MTDKTSLRDSIVYNSAMFLFSFAVMALETLFMHQLLIITNYLTATFVISLAMLGIAFGSFISFYIARFRGFWIILVAALFFAASIPLSYYNIVRIGEYGYPYFLVLPFFFAAIIISLLFSKANSNKIYFANLIASAAGVIFPIFTVSSIKSENTLIVIMFIPAVAIFMLVFAFRNIFLKIIPLVISIALAFCSWYFLSANLKLPEKLSKQEYEQKIMPAVKFKFDRDFMLSRYKLQGDDYIFSGSNYEKKRAKYVLNDIGYGMSDDPETVAYWKNLDINYKIKCDDLNRINPIKQWCAHMHNWNWKMVLSEDDLMGKIDLFAVNDDNIFFCTNAIPLDTVDKGNGTYYDPRVPHIENPKIFIIGLSYDGIVKSAKRQPGGKVSGVEFSPIIMRIMMENNREGYFSQFASYPYKDVEAHEAEGRYFLQSNNEVYDMITLMNLHYEYTAIATLAPEFLHTVEALDMMLGKLSDKGMLVYEEIIETKRGRFAFYKFLNTIKKTLTDMGVKDPSQHVIVYSWDFWGKNKQFQTVLIKRAPFTQKELATFASYHAVIAPKYGSEIFVHPVIRSNHKFEQYFKSTEPKYYEKDYPDGITKKELYTDIIEKLDNAADKTWIENLYSYNKTFSKYYLKKKTMTQADNTRLETLLSKASFPYEIDLSPTTDDKPFPFNIYVNKKEVSDFFNIILKLASILLIPILLLFAFKYRSNKMRLMGHTVFFGLLGFGFMMIELVLMQKYQRFIGSPIYSTMVILGGLLLFSGLGSFISRNFSRRVLIICVAIIPVMILFQTFFLDGLFIMFAKFSFTAKLFISSGLIFPLAFFMGMPFPHALEQIKKDISNEYATLMFGVNGALATIGVSLSYLLNVTYGMSTTLLLGFATYLAALVLFIIIKK
ncbi:MAG TPA: hypothetical protein PK514_10405 [Spirochaetota bacterium]|nr:hypothetical protein [Spirochaetota bacterium]